MKALCKLSFLMLSVLFFISCKPSGKAAARYNDKMIRYQLKVVEMQKSLSDAINDGKNVAEMKSMLDRFMSEVKNSSDSIAAMEAFDGRDEFKKSALDYMNQLNALGQNEYAQLVKLMEIPDSVLTRDDENKARELEEQIKSKTDNAFKGLETQQNKFATEYNFVVKGGK